MMTFRVFGFLCTYCVMVYGMSLHQDGDELKGAVTSLTSTLQSNASEVSNVAVMPTLNVDLLTLLRVVAQQELQNNQAQRVETQTQKHLDKIKVAGESLLNLTRTLPSTDLDIFTLGDKKYFYPRLQKFSWMEAISFCRLYGMDLLSVETKEEDDLLVRHITSEDWWKGETIIYMSGNKIGRPYFTWLTGELVKYVNWNEGDPDGGDQMCMAYYEGKWIDVFCQNRFYNFMCESY